jgi:aminoglycoside phosphotransferase (APT) family kinase protein
MTVPRTVTAFQSSRRIASGPLLAVASAVKSVIDAHDPEPVLIFDDHSSELVDVDFRGTPDEVRDRLARAFPQDQPGARGRGRPKLGVVAREVTLLPRHWDWLAEQSGGASAALRRLIDEARRGAATERRRAQTALYRFMTAMAGDAAGYEEAIRALFAGDRARFDSLIEAWAPDVRDHAWRLAPAAFGEAPSALDAFIPQERREAVLRAVEAAFPGAAIEKVEAITGGASGALIFKVVVRGADYLLRLEIGRDAFRDPERQYACLRIAAEAGVAPKLFYADARDGVAITDFVRAAPGDADKARGVRAVAIVDQLLRLHAAPLFPRLVDYMQGMETLIGQVRETAILPPKGLFSMLSAFGALKAAYPAGAPDLVSSHNDLNPNNILFDGERPWFVDWESAFAADRYVDLATVANCFAKSEAEREAVLRAYFGAALDDYRRARFFLMRQINRLFYATVMLNAAAAERPGARLTAVDLDVPRLADIQGEVGDLTTYDGRVRAACVFLNEAVHDVASPRFASAAARVAAG